MEGFAAVVVLELAAPHANATATTPPRPVQGELFCPASCGSGVITATDRNHDGDPVLVPAICPVCRPRPSDRETRLAAVALARRLAAGAQR
jgi:hypothetical protein